MLKPITDAEAAHWCDEFAGDVCEPNDLSEFLLATVFTTAPQKLHDTLKGAIESVKLCKDAHAMFHVELPAAMTPADKVVRAGLVTKNRRPDLRRLARVPLKTVKLKREMNSLYEKVEDDTWVLLHPMVQELVAKFSPSAAKRPKLG